MGIRGPHLADPVRSVPCPCHTADPHPVLAQTSRGQTVERRTHPKLGQWFSPLTHPTPLFDRKLLESPLNIPSCRGEWVPREFPSPEREPSRVVKSTDSGASGPGLNPFICYFLGDPRYATFPLCALVFSTVKSRTMIASLTSQSWREHRARVRREGPLPRCLVPCTLQCRSYPQTFQTAQSCPP